MQTIEATIHSAIVLPFEATIVSARFEGVSRVERHRLVYASLGTAMSGPIHALALKTFTPAEA
jgi:stress-induced morphogen